MNGFVERYGKWALVTGGSSGIGAAISRQLAAKGLNIVLVARNRSALDEHADLIRKKEGVDVRVVDTDLSLPGSVNTIIDAVEDLEIGIFVPCAAIEWHGYFVDIPIEKHHALLQIDLIGPTFLSHYLGAKMAKRGRGAILLVSSLAGWMAQPYMASYGAAKAYILALGGALHLEMKDKGVDVSVLSPGPTDTPMAKGTGIDFESMGMVLMQAEDVATLGLDALSKHSDSVPGARNKMMLFIMTRLMPRSMAGLIYKKLSSIALGIKY